MGCCIATFTAFTMAFIVCTVHLAIQHTDCDVADIELPESRTHLPPSDNQSVQRIAVASCFQVGSEPSSALWRHVRHSFVAEHFVWLGDNAYSDGVSMTHKRARYHAARHAKYYADIGPVAEPRITTSGVWDDHDYASNNQGRNYMCRRESQNEFVRHFGLKASDPRHPDHPGGQREGVYSSVMFARGVHLIHLDTRYHRSPTFDSYGECEGPRSTMLGYDQWAWLEGELRRPSAVKLIASSVQVLPPTNPTHRGLCAAAHDPNRTFEAANAFVGEGHGHEGTRYESWSEMPQERTRLLRMVDDAMEVTTSGIVVFLTGDQHWAEVMKKRLPRGGNVYELTASGIGQNWVEDIINTNRLTDDDPMSTRTAHPSVRCSGSGHHVCRATSNYGQVDIDFSKRTVVLRIATPHDEPSIASEVRIPFAA